MSAKAETLAPTRRVRPWIAALLTVLGWGVGLYYARRTSAAVRFAIAQVLAGALIVFTGVAALYRADGDFAALYDPDQWSVADTISVAASALAALIVWRLVAGQSEAPRAGPMRLFGYLAIWLAPILIAALLGLTLRVFVLHPFRQPSASMAPTLEAGEYFIVEKWRYGYSRYAAAPLDRLLPAGRWLARAPARGDVVVFRPPHQPERDFVQRLIGLPGDRVQMIAGAPHINGEAVRREDLGETAFSFGDGRSHSARLVRETLPDGASYLTLDSGESGLDFTREFIVPEGHYFMLGDNRDNANDSRLEIGFVPFDNLIGPAVIRARAPSAD